MKVGIFGGSFNPPHKMHEKMAYELLGKKYVDMIIYVPTGSKYKYKNNLISDSDRYNMLKIMTKEDKRFLVSDYELQDHVIYTCETLKHFAEIYGQGNIYFICGTDNLSYIDKWKNGLEILENYKVIVVRRSGEDIAELLEKFKIFKNNIIVSEVSPNELSSTFIREKLKSGEDVGDYLNQDVLDYIQKNLLYEEK